MSFKVADAYVAVTADETGLAADLRAKVVAAMAEATEGLEATVGLGLNSSAPEDFRADLDTALLLTTEGLEAHVGMGLKDDAVEELDADVKAGIDLVEADAKVKVTVDPKSAQDAGQGASSLIVAAIGAGLALGPAALLTGTAAVLVGVEGLVQKSNVVIAADYQKLGEDGANAIKAATAPLTGDLNQALTNLDGSLTKLQPKLDSLFAGAGPDIGLFESGAVNLASNTLPGLSAAVASSQADVAGFAAGLGPLGSGVGDFFTGLTTNSQTTADGLQSVMGTLGSAVGTVGTIVGSASSAISTDLLAIDPVLNTLSGSIRAVADPATVGGLLGAFGAMKSGEAISGGLETASSKLLSLSDHAGIASGALLKSSSALDTMSGVMGGPWGIALGAGVGLLSGFVGMMINAQHATDALTLSQSDLQKAIAQDGGSAGSATAAYVAQAASQDGLAASAQKAGVSLATWTSAVTGNKQAQSDVTAAVDKLNASQLKQGETTAENAQITGKASGDLQQATVTVLAHSDATNKLTDTNQQLISSMFAQSGQIASTISDQQKMSAALMTLSNNTAIFNATLDAANTAAQLQYRTSAQSSVALLGLGDNQSALNQKLVNGEAAYSAASGAAGAYNTVLSSLNGATMTADQAQNTLAQDMLNAKTSFKQNGDSLDLNTQAGINNRQSLTAAAQAITQLGVANINSGGNINSANAVIQQQITAFVNATGATGKAKDAITTYLEQIAKVPPDVSTTITANTGPAQQDVVNFLSWVDNQAAITGTIQVDMGSIKQSGQLPHKALGGHTPADQPIVVGDGGRPEVFVPDRPGTIIPSIPAANAILGAGQGAPGAAQPQTVIQFYGQQYPNGEQWAQIHRELASVGSF